MQVVPPSATAVDRALAHVLSLPEFAGPHDPAWRKALRQGWQWLVQHPGHVLRPLLARLDQALHRVLEGLGRLLRWLLPHFDTPSGRWGAYGHVALLVLGIAGLGVLGYLAVRGYRRRRARRVAAAGDTQETPPRTADEWEARARVEETAGRWREAALALYQAVLHRQAERGALRLDPAKTPGDYRREARRDATLAPSLEAFLRRFEPVAFGLGRGDADAYGSLRQLATGLGAHG